LRPANPISPRGQKSRRNFGLQAKERALLSNAFFVLTIPPPVTHHPSRKHFFAKLLGLVAVSGVLPKVVAGPAGGTVPAAGGQPELQGKIVCRGDSRTVARRVDSL
jgi:hypothetical protein